MRVCQAALIALLLTFLRLSNKRQLVCSVEEADSQETGGEGTNVRMSAILLDGRSLVARLRAELAEKAQSIAAERGRRASLALIIAGENATALFYGAQVQRSCARAGVDCALLRLPGEIGEADLR